MKTNPTNPAFPTQDFYDGQLAGAMPGLSKREYFAAMAMQSFLTGGQIETRIAVKWAVQAADQLIAELNKSEDDDIPY